MPPLHLRAVRAATGPSLAFCRSLARPHSLSLSLFNSSRVFPALGISKSPRIPDFREMAGDFPFETDTDDSDSEFVELDPSGRYGRVSWFFREFDSFLTSPFLIFRNYLQIDALILNSLPPNVYVF